MGYLDYVFNNVASVIKSWSNSVYYELYLCEENEERISYFMRSPENSFTSSKITVGIRLVDKFKSACVSIETYENDEGVRNRLIPLLDAAKEAMIHSPDDPDTYLCDFSSKPEKVDLSLEDGSPFVSSEIKYFAANMEEVALAYDSRIKLVEESSVSLVKKGFLLANSSSGVLGEYSKSFVSASVSVVACDKGSMETGYAFSACCKCNDLRSSNSLGEESASRAIARLGSSQVKSGNYPILIERRIAGDFLDSFVSAINGSGIVTGGSFLIDSLGKKIFNESVNIVDDPLIHSGLFSRPFDGEGFSSKKQSFIESGILLNWILDGYHANKLKIKTAASCSSRCLDGSIVPGITNFYIENGNNSLDSMLSNIKCGIFVTEFIGFGVNIATGDYSRGASGFLIENGVKTSPICNFTIAGNLKDLFLNMEIGDDLIIESKVNAPTILLPNVVVAGV